MCRCGGSPGCQRMSLRATAGCVEHKTTAVPMSSPREGAGGCHLPGQNPPPCRQGCTPRSACSHAPMPATANFFVTSPTSALAVAAGTSASGAAKLEITAPLPAAVASWLLPWHLAGAATGAPWVGTAGPKSTAAAAPPLPCSSLRTCGYVWVDGRTRPGLASPPGAGCSQTAASQGRARAGAWRGQGAQLSGGDAGRQTPLQLPRGCPSHGALPCLVDRVGGDHQRVVRAKGQHRHVAVRCPVQQAARASLNHKHLLAVVPVRESRRAGRAHRAAQQAQGSTQHGGCIRIRALIQR